ncbi:Alpha-(1,3)-Fucosyltransferase 11 [Manis pentadactyla]|nr:Alpha-(1,3)-Fucosyltransferase 11 [Manis pentadactyla]
MRLLVFTEHSHVFGIGLGHQDAKKGNSGSDRQPEVWFSRLSIGPYRKLRLANSVQGGSWPGAAATDSSTIGRSFTILQWLARYRFHLTLHPCTIVSDILAARVWSWPLGVKYW